ncbi:dehydrogenase [Actinoplanes cyaneus]|uniref:Dehydrogenase n=1 Tax=Actinoplanes cyaneus TaxID=52696 RepID=A0A919IWI7_9ACTN|nr:Gfo/Idh/MocA family oxidoreductase [Actinoplanes cyaneus]MCW2144327.1 putative dehydrogenase [Actinoplanes cyaneus]GID71083.1 dehydrogenase [Actinoplanes cyaneus]
MITPPSLTRRPAGALPRTDTVAATDQRPHTRYRRGPGRLRVAVIGLGHMGRRHAAVLHRLDHVELAAVVDPAGDPHHAAGTAVLLPSIDDLARRHIDYAVLACPTAAHTAIGEELARLGIATLIEKPLAHDLPAALRLQKAFTGSSATAAIGHIERFQPAVAAMRQLLATGHLGDIAEISTQRVSMHPGRITDVGVTLDLAIHDIDLTSWLTGHRYTHITASTRHHLGHAHEDVLTATGHLTDGTIVTHRANWLTPTATRLITITAGDGCLTADTRRNTLWHYQHHHSAPVPVLSGDPLTTEHHAFAALLEGHPSTIADLTAGVHAVAVADAARQAAATGHPTTIPH